VFLVIKKIQICRQHCLLLFALSIKRKWADGSWPPLILFSHLPLSMFLPFCHPHCPLISLFTICLSIELTAKPPGRGRENKPIQLSEVQQRDISPLKHPVPLSSSLSESTHTLTHICDKEMAKLDKTNKQYILIKKKSFQQKTVQNLSYSELLSRCNCKLKG